MACPLGVSEKMSYHEGAREQRGVRSSFSETTPYINAKTIEFVTHSLLQVLRKISVNEAPNYFYGCI
jgi:hypothetical protein